MSAVADSAATVGHPYKLTSEVHEAIVRAARLGASRQHQADCGLVSKSTLCRWLAVGEQVEEGPERQLYLAIKRAEANLRQQCLETLATAAKSDWRAALARLEMRWPEHYSSRRRLEIVGAGGGPVEIVGALARLSDAELERVIIENDESDAIRAREEIAAEEPVKS